MINNPFLILWEMSYGVIQFVGQLSNLMFAGFDIGGTTYNIWNTIINPVAFSVVFGVIMVKKLVPLL